MNRLARVGDIIIIKQKREPYPPCNITSRVIDLTESTLYLETGRPRSRTPGASWKLANLSGYVR